MARDRVFINRNYRPDIDDMKSKDLLGFSLVENKESFLLAVALGIDSPETVKERDGWFLMKNLKTADKALLAAVLLGNVKDDNEIDKYADFEKSLDLCEECAEKGFQELRKRVVDSNGDRELFERRLMKEMDLWYTSIIDNDL